jgi:hypothetical protein
MADPVRRSVFGVRASCPCRCVGAKGCLRRECPGLNLPAGAPGTALRQRRGKVAPRLGVRLTDVDSRAMA